MRKKLASLFLSFILLVFSCQTNTSQKEWDVFDISQNKIRQEVLTKNQVDSLFVFGKWDEDEGTETRLKFLGQIKSQKENYKIVTSTSLWGLSRRATNRILVFDEVNQYLGNYYGFYLSNLPEKIENHQLIFFHLDNEDCDSKIINKFSFKNGIPNEFFIECKNGMGDIYAFDPDN